MNFRNYKSFHCRLQVFYYFTCSLHEYICKKIFQLLHQLCLGLSNHDFSVGLCIFLQETIHLLSFYNYIYNKIVEMFIILLLYKEEIHL